MIVMAVNPGAESPKRQDWRRGRRTEWARQDLIDELAERNLKHIEVARRMGVHPKYLSWLLNGKRPWPLRTARDFSFATGIPLVKILPSEES